MTVRVEVVQGVEGASIYINDLRIAGPKPWGGGKLLHSWKVDVNRITEAINGNDNHAPCSTCNGKKFKGDGGFSTQEPCPNCNGTGEERI